MPALLAAFILAVALAMDAFAMALVQGAAFRPNWRDTAKIALLFGIFQGGMPLIGWAIGAVALNYAAAVDHWIAFALLAFLGGRMLMNDDDEGPAKPLAGWTLILAAIAESIDALAAGFTLPTIGLPILLTCAVITVVTTVISVLAVKLGSIAGQRYGRPAEIFGGLMLIAIGCYILVTHLTG